ncbi:MAG: hypothetical protein NVS1B6_15720 [Steroidobacteraceae bacterium]
MHMAATTLADRALVRLSGENVRSFLQGLVTNDVTRELPVWAALLTPQGKCLFDFLVWADGEDLLLDCEADAADGLVERLSIYRLRRPIGIEQETSLAVHWATEGQAGTIDPRLAQLGRRWLAPPSTPTSGWRKHRLGLGVCEGVAELGGVLWLECNAAELNGVSFSKGCFIGQENTARMNWRGKVNRRLVVCRGSAGKRSQVEYPALGLFVMHQRVDSISPEAILPAWLQSALAQSATA